MASTNFLIFDEGKQNMMSDGDYNANTQRARGVTPGIAYPNLHNKLYYQVSVMAKAIADFIVSQGANANDEDVEQLTADISTAFTNFVDNQTKDLYLPLSGGTMEGLVSLFTGSTVPTPEEQDNSKKITNTEWVQTWVKSFVSELSTNIEVETQEDGHFSCPALGITGLMAQNGYICLGKLFGNLILQWGAYIITNAGTGVRISFPIRFKYFPYIVKAQDGGYSCYSTSTTSFDNSTTAEIYMRNIGQLVAGTGCWFSIGI